MILVFSPEQWHEYAEKHFGPDSNIFAIAFGPVRQDIKDLRWRDPHRIASDWRKCGEADDPDV